MSKKAKQISTYLVIALGASLVLGGIFTVLSMQTFAKTEILVASRDIEPYSGEILAEDFTTIEVAKGDAASFESFVNNPEELIGKIPTTAIYQGQPVKEVQFVNPEDSASLQSIVTDEKNRGLYLPVSYSNALCGDMKVGGIYDIYLSVTTPNTNVNDKNSTSLTVVPLQTSYKMNKFILNEDGSMYIFVEFPVEESEEYVMLKKLVENEDIEVVVTMPNAIHEYYDAESLEYSEFFGALLKNPNYFTSISQLENNVEDVEVNNDVEINSTTSNENVSEDNGNKDKIKE